MSVFIVSLTGVPAESPIGGSSEQRHSLVILVPAETDSHARSMAVAHAHPSYRDVVVERAAVADPSRVAAMPTDMREMLARGETVMLSFHPRKGSRLRALLRELFDGVRWPR